MERLGEILTHEGSEKELELVIEVQSSDGEWRVDPRHRCAINGETYKLIAAEWPEPGDELYELVLNQQPDISCRELDRTFAGAFTCDDLNAALEEASSRFCYLRAQP